MPRLNYHSPVLKCTTRTCRSTLEDVPCAHYSLWPLIYSVCAKHLPLECDSDSIYLVKRQDVFGQVGKPASLVQKIVGFDEAIETYRAFDKGEVGKVLFNPWLE